MHLGAFQSDQFFADTMNIEGHSLDWSQGPVIKYVQIDVIAIGSVSLTLSSSIYRMVLCARNVFHKEEY